MQNTTEQNSIVPENYVPLVMVVDDDFSSNLTLKTILVQEGFRAVTAFDSASCFEAMARQAPDLILLDVEFPEESGFDICRKIHEDPLTNEIPILFISANDDLSSKVKGFEVGGVDYITKPWQKEEILARVRTHLRLRQALLNRIELQSMRLNRLKAAQDAILVKAVDAPEAKFSVMFRPLQEVGGDFYDVIPIGEKVYDYVVADISGHDVGIALVTSALKMLFRQNCSILSTPRDAVFDINRAITSVLQPGQFVALTIVRINRKAGRAWVVNAGGPSPVLYSAEDKSCRPVEVTGDLVGLFPDVSFQLKEIKVSPGDRIFIFSDGLLDLFNNESYRWQVKMELVTELFGRIAETPAGSLQGALAKQVDGLPVPEDDMVVLCLEV